MITRFSVLPDKRRLVLGVDKAEIFEVGVVYEAVKIMDEILLRPIGKYALDERGELERADNIIESGFHLVTPMEIEELKEDFKTKNKLSNNENKKKN